MPVVEGKLFQGVKYLGTVAEPGKSGRSRQNLPTAARASIEQPFTGALTPNWMISMDLNSLDLPKRPEDTRVVVAMSG
ncbi:MAG TPA: hypothetical protein VHB19_12580, partial [Devosia sp.]|nr:hypothetical protein [Devosia sp.]